MNLETNLSTDKEGRSIEGKLLSSNQIISLRVEESTFLETAKRLLNPAPTKGEVGWSKTTWQILTSLKI